MLLLSLLAHPHPHAHAHAYAQTEQTLSIRGHDQVLKIYGPSGGDPVIVSSGDGGWTHLIGAHLANLRARDAAST